MELPTEVWRVSDPETERALVQLRGMASWKFLLAKMQAAGDRHVRLAAYPHSAGNVFPPGWHAGRLSVLIELIDAATDERVK